MTFTERPFLWFFLAFFLGWHLLRSREKYAVPFLLIASLGFYGHNHWTLLPILIVYSVIDWFVARRMEASLSPGRWLALGVGFNLIVLAYFKYTPLLVITFEKLFGIAGDPARFERWQIPYGISFFAFTGVAYLVDVYRRVHPAVGSLSRYTLSAAFFPHLVAGPILRPGEFLNQLEPGKMPTRSIAVREAVILIAIGYLKKLMIADRIGETIDPFFAHIGDSSTAGVWSLPFVYLYALQIYFDFSAYSDIARGLALLYGYRWPENFAKPYLALNITDFWRRWHITLSRFLRDYLYIPLGGNRGGWWRTNRNLLITMLLGGLWHGASWSFLMWGGLHGLYLIAHRGWQALPIANRFRHSRIWQAVAWALTFHVVCLAWCFFRLTVWGESLECVRRVFVFDRQIMFLGGAWAPGLWVAITGGILLIMLAEKLMHVSFEKEWQPGFAWGYACGLILLAILLAPAGETGAFIYFQF